MRLGDVSVVAPVTPTCGIAQDPVLAADGSWSGQCKFTPLGLFMVPAQLISKLSPSIGNALQLPMIRLAIPCKGSFGLNGLAVSVGVYIVLGIFLFGGKKR